MKVKLTLTEEELKELIQDAFDIKTNQCIKVDDIKIMVKSKQNYKSEWEVASFKAEYEGEI